MADQHSANYPTDNIQSPIAQGSTITPCLYHPSLCNAQYPQKTWTFQNLINTLRDDDFLAARPSHRCGCFLWVILKGPNILGRANRPLNPFIVSRQPLHRNAGSASG